MEKESKDADTVQTAVAIRSWATLKSERTQKTPVPSLPARGFSLKTALVKKGNYIPILFSRPPDREASAER